MPKLPYDIDGLSSLKWAADDKLVYSLREIDCSSAVVGGPAAGAVSGGKSIHRSHMWRQKVLHNGCCGWWHNYYSQQMQADRANEQSISLRCLWDRVVVSINI